MGRQALCDDATFLATVEEYGSVKAAEILGYSSSQAVSNRLRAIREQSSTGSVENTRVHLKVRDGTVIVGSDAHYWPGTERSTAHVALVRLVRELGPVAVVLNGDVIDAPSVSRHGAIGWEKRPDLWDEIITAKKRLREIEDAFPRDETGGLPATALIWTLGNHDARFETFVANHAGQFRGVPGIHLKDHFPLWLPAWAVWINIATDLVVVKHRMTGGGNLLKQVQLAGCHVVTGHRHRANVVAFSTYTKILYGVDTGFLGVPYGPQFTNYTEDNPVDWRSSVTVLTFRNGRLLPPEQLLVLNEEERLTSFRGQLNEEEK